MGEDPTFVPAALRPLVQLVAEGDLYAAADALRGRFSSAEALEAFLEFAETSESVGTNRIAAVRHVLRERSQYPDATEPVETETALGGLCVYPHPIPPLVACWYLSDHHDLDRTRRTRIGSLVYEAKTYEGKPGRPDRARELSELMAAGAKFAASRRQFHTHRIGLVVPVPCFPPKEPHNLPELLAAAVAGQLQRPCSLETLAKVAPTPPAKRSDPEAMRKAIGDAYQVQGNAHVDSVVVLIDDVIHHGTTLGALAQILIGAGAKAVGGYVATRARVGMAR